MSATSLARLPLVSACLLLGGCDAVVEQRADAPVAAAAPALVVQPQAASPEPKPSAVEADALELDEPPMLRGHYLVTKLIEPDGTSRNPVHHDTGELVGEVSYVGIAFEDDWIQLRLQCLIEGDFEGPDPSRRYFTFGSAATSTNVRWTKRGPVLAGALSLVAKSTVIERVGTRRGKTWQIDWADDSKECTFGIGKGIFVLTTEGETAGRPAKARLEEPAGRVWELEAVEGWVTTEEIHRRINDVVGMP